MASNRSDKKDRLRAEDAYRAIGHIEKMMERLMKYGTKFQEKNGNQNDKKAQ
jgi:hypothetical protein